MTQALLGGTLDCFFFFLFCFFLPILRWTFFSPQVHVNYHGWKEAPAAFGAEAKETSTYVFGVIVHQCVLAAQTENFLSFSIIK